jgi:ABC-2 type transport system ATP-binding protein
MANGIELDGLTVRFGDFVAVDGLSLDVRAGEIFGLLGPNGAGKTTTFLSLTRQISSYEGRIELLGLNAAKEFRRVKPQMGYVPDVENHFDEFTAGQNLRIFADLYGVSRSRVDASLEAVELLREKDIPVRAYSRGMRKKLLLARELIHQPKLLLLDEPTANLDVHSTERIREVMKELAAGGTTILMTTHNMREVEEVCDRVAIVNHGKLIDLDSPMAFKSRNTERVVDVVLQRESGHERISVDLDKDDQREELARIMRSEIPVTIHTREFNFYQVFLRLTGEEYN